jgi:hypothetical protein
MRLRRINERIVRVAERGMVMTIRKVFAVSAVIMLAVSLPFVIVHLMAAPDDAPITPVQQSRRAIGAKGALTSDPSGPILLAAHHKRGSKHEFNTETISGASSEEMGQEYRGRITHLDGTLPLWLRAVVMGSGRHPLEGYG